MQTPVDTPTGLEEIRLKEKEKIIAINDLSSAQLNIAIHEIMGLQKYASIDMRGRITLKLPVCLDPTKMWQGIQFDPSGGDAESIDWVVERYRPLITSLATGGFSVQIDDVETHDEYLSIAVCRAVIKRFYLTDSFFYFDYNLKV